MKIVADENIPFVRELFGRLGEAHLLAGRAIRPDDVRDADALVVRSVTRVNDELLDGSRVRFVGTCTIGTDHIDTGALGRRGIAFASAPGSNAESVADYVAAALAFDAARRGRRLSESSIGIVGVGNCGGRVERIARALGMEVRLNDPPLARRTGDARYRPLAELLGCDYLTLHVPLTREGEDPTWDLIGAEVFSRLSPETVLINASRMFVVDEAALMRRLTARRLAGAVLDAWVDEPHINRELLGAVTLGTPHIAGYSFDGKVNGARMIHAAACAALGVDAEDVALPLPEPAVPVIRLNAAGRTADSVLAELILTAYPIWRDAMDLRTSPAPGVTPAEHFDRCRKLYPLRREFAATRVELAGAAPELLEAARQLGFAVD